MAGKKKKQKKRRGRIIVLIDYENLDKNTSEESKKSVGQFLDDIAKDDDIISFQVFLPTYLSSKAISTLSNIYDAKVVYIYCPRNWIAKNGVLKEKDTVDFKMTMEGIDIINNYKKITKIIIVAGDFDFNYLRNYAKRRGIEVKIMSAEKSLSKNYLLAAADLEIL